MLSNLGNKEEKNNLSEISQFPLNCMRGKGKKLIRDYLQFKQHWKNFSKINLKQRFHFRFGYWFFSNSVGWRLDDAAGIHHKNTFAEWGFSFSFHFASTEVLEFSGKFHKSQPVPLGPAGLWFCFRPSNQENSFFLATLFFSHPPVYLSFYLSSHNFCLFKMVLLQGPKQNNAD